MLSFKREICGNGTNVVVRPHRCPKCGARRGMLHTAEDKK
jgi:hypothetical protein